MDLIKLEMKSLYAEKKDVQKANYNLDEFSAKFDKLVKAQKEQREALTAAQGWERGLSDFRVELAAFKQIVETRLAAAESQREESGTDLNESKNDE